MPIIRHDSPYYTPLSLPTWHILIGARFFVYWFLRWFNSSVFYHSAIYDHYLLREQSYRKSLVQGMQRTAEETALKSPPEIDVRAFMWTFDCLDEDHELEGFFSGLPSFRSSKVVEDPLPSLTTEEKGRLYDALEGLLSRTFSSDLLSAPVKNRRAMICAKAIDPELTPDPFRVLHIAVSEYGHTDPLTAIIAKILRGCVTTDGNVASYYAQLAISEVVVARRQSYDDSWYSLASDELAIPRVVLRDYAAHGDSLLLLNLIYAVRLQFNLFKKPSWPKYGFSFVLKAASNLDVKDTLPKLRHEFCALWNQIVNEVQDSNNRDMASFILRRIRNVFLALHGDTNSAPTQFSTSTNDWDVILCVPSSYPVCKVPGHHPTRPRTHHDFASLANPFTPAVPDDHDDISLVPSLPSPDLPSLSTDALLLVDEALTDAPLVDNNIYLPFQTTPDKFRVPSSPSPVTSCVIRGSVDTYPRSMHLSASEPSTSGPRPKFNASASPPDDVTVGRRTKLSCAPSDDPNGRSSPSPTPILDATLPTGLLLLFHVMT